MEAAPDMTAVPGYIAILAINKEDGTMKLVRSCAVLVMVAAILGGCCGGGTTKVHSETTTTTTGQQLIDLKKALDSGAITEDQYNKMKHEIIEKSGGIRWEE